MAAEFYLRFDPPDWQLQNQSVFEQLLRGLSSFRGKQDQAWLLQGTEGTSLSSPLGYDVRFIPVSDCAWLMEISAHPPSIERDLRQFMHALRALTAVVVEDEDGLATDW